MKCLDSKGVELQINDNVSYPFFPVYMQIEKRYGIVIGIETVGNLSKQFFCEIETTDGRKLKEFPSKLTKI